MQTREYLRRASTPDLLVEQLAQALITATRKHLCLSCLNSQSLSDRFMWRKFLGQQTARILRVRFSQLSGMPWFFRR
jgi:hypothetical protein